MAQAEEYPRFPIVAQIQAGLLVWGCPCCSELNYDHMCPGKNRVRCRNARCRRSYGLGIVLHECRPGLAGRPPDTYQEGFPFLAGQLAIRRYRYGFPVHRFVVETLADSEELTATDICGYGRSAESARVHPLENGSKGSIG